MAARRQCAPLSLGPLAAAAFCCSELLGWWRTRGADCHCGRGWASVREAGAGQVPLMGVQPFGVL